MMMTMMMVMMMMMMMMMLVVVVVAVVMMMVSLTTVPPTAPSCGRYRCNRRGRHQSHALRRPRRRPRGRPRWGLGGQRADWLRRRRRLDLSIDSYPSQSALDDFDGFVVLAGLAPPHALRLGLRFAPAC
jgi:hypothetical protein